MRCVILALFGFLGLSAYGQGFVVQGFPGQVIPVTVRKMTSVIFPCEIGAGIWVTRDVRVERAKWTRNAIELKAERKDFAPTNLAVYGRDGRLYSFELRYVEDTPVLNFLVAPVASGRPVAFTDVPVPLTVLDSDAVSLSRLRGFLRISGSSEGLRMRLAGVWSRDSLMWLVLRVRNTVPVGLGASSFRLYVEDRKQVKRMASQEVEVTPVYVSAFSGDSFNVAVAVRPLFVSSGRRLVVSFGSVSGDREVRVRVKGKVLRKVRKG